MRTEAKEPLTENLKLSVSPAYIEHRTIDKVSIRERGQGVGLGTLC